MNGKFDIAVVGGGPAGYVAAIRGAQLGARVVLFEKDVVGGTCLNRGCIPTKTYLKTAEYLRDIRRAGERGIKACGEAAVDMPAAVKYKDGVVKTLTGGVASLLKANGVTTVSGEAFLASERSVECAGEIFEAENIIICTGSRPGTLPVEGAGCESVLTSTELLNAREIPGRLCIIGGGVIGCELATVFGAFGSEVTIVEMADRVAPMFEKELSKEVGDSLKKAGVKLKTGARLEKIELRGAETAVVTNCGEVLCDKVLMAVGRRPELACLGALKDKIKTDGGSITADEYLRTSVRNIYACGDVNGKMMLTHAAYHMGEIAAENCMGANRRCDLRLVPNCMYADPEVASVGLTEAEAREKYGSVSVGMFRMGANGRAIASGERAGVVKVVADGRYGEILGVHIAGGVATEMISEAVALMANEITLQETIKNVVHPHPSYTEAFYEACLDALGRGIHLPPKKK